LQQNVLRVFALPGAKLRLITMGMTKWASNFRVWQKVTPLSTIRQYIMPYKLQNTIYLYYSNNCNTYY